MYRIVSLLIGYGLGLIQTSYIVGKFSGIDIRKYGSGNSGATNTLRVLGAKAGFFVFICDILKGVAAFTICGLLFGGGGTFLGQGVVNPGLYGGLGAILGHCFPFYLNFKGGKGMASALGIILCINPILIISLSLIGVICVLLSRYISLASLVIAAVLPIGAILLSLGSEAALLCFFMGGLIWFLHRENIKRLINGNENKFIIKKRGLF